MNDRHVIEALGKAEVVIENGKITYIGEPVVDYCSIFDNGQHNGAVENRHGFAQRNPPSSNLMRTRGD